MRSGINSIFAEQMPPLSLSLARAGYNPGIVQNPNPLPFNADGGPFLYQDWSQGGAWATNPSATGQAALLAANVPDATALPVYPSPGINSVLNMSQALLGSRAQWRATRYGALSFAVADAAGQEFVYIVHANYSGAHAVSCTLALALAAFARCATRSDATWCPSAAGISSPHTYKRPNPSISRHTI